MPIEALVVARRLLARNAYRRDDELIIGEFGHPEGPIKFTYGTLRQLVELAS